MAKAKPEPLVAIVARHRIKFDGETYEPRERFEVPASTAATLIGCKAAEAAPAEAKKTDA